MQETLDRLGEALRRNAPDRASAALCAPVTDHDLATLRAAIAPVELPDDLVTLLRWSDGFGEELWRPFGYEGFDGAARIADQYRFWQELCGDDIYEEFNWRWCPTWIPISALGGAVDAIDLSPEGQLPILGVDTEVHVTHPDLRSAIASLASVLEAGIPLFDPDAGDDEAITWEQSVDDHVTRHQDWGLWPYDRVIVENAAWWPPRWRRALGLPPEPDGEWRQPTPIGALVAAGGDAVVSIEGATVITRGLLSREANGLHPEDDRTAPILLEVRDSTGSLGVLVERPLFQHWMQTGVRAQFDVVVGAQADEAAARWIWHPDAPRVGAVVLSARPATQGRPPI